MKKEITVLIPTFNRDNLLDRAVHSLSQQNQEIKIHCIISDNSSFDNTQDVVNKWKKQDKNLTITYIKHKNPISPFMNWKSMIDLIDTEYSKFLFDDDWLEPQSLNIMLNDINEYDAKCIIYNTNIYAKTHNYEPLRDYYKHNTCELTKEKIIDSVLRITDPLPVTPSAAIHESILLKNSINFSQIESNCTNMAIGNDLIMNYYPVFENQKTYFKNQSLINLWGGEDSITIKTSNGKLLSFCYLQALIYLIDEFDYKPKIEQLRKINHKIFVNNLRANYSQDLKKFKKTKTFKPLLSLYETLTYLKR